MSMSPEGLRCALLTLASEVISDSPQNLSSDVLLIYFGLPGGFGGCPATQGEIPGLAKSFVLLLEKLPSTSRMAQAPNWNRKLELSELFFKRNCAAANGGVTNGGSGVVWPPFQNIGQNQPFSPFLCLFHTSPEGPNYTWQIQKTEEKAFFLRYPLTCLSPLL